MRHPAPRPSIAKAFLALALTDIFLFMLGDTLQTIATIRNGGRAWIDGDWWLMLLVLFPILLAPATLCGLLAHVLLRNRLTCRALSVLAPLVGGLATGGFLLLIAIADDYFTRRGSEHLYALAGFAAGALWGAIYAALLLRRNPTVRHPRA